jgi:acetyltransferase, GNAT family
MLKLGLKYAKEIFAADKVSLGVFENNESAYYCYKAIGFEDVPPNEIEKYNVMGEEWDCLELEIKL